MPVRDTGSSPGTAIACQDRPTPAESAETAPDPSGLCALVRESCRAVAEAARLVNIDDERIEKYAINLADADVVADAATSSKPAATAAQPVGAELAPRDVELTAAEVLTVNAVNFGSGYHDIVDKDPGRSGSRTMAARWARHLDDVGVDIDQLRRLSTVDCALIFGQRLDHPGRRELMQLFAEALNQLGDHVAERFDGSFIAVLEDAAGSAEALAQSLLAMPFYLDRTPLDGDLVHFYKRAQITAADLGRALPGHAAARFTDLDELTAFADNLVPHVLMVDGLINYEPELVERIERGDLLPAGSRSEIEIRAVGVEVVERLTGVLRRRGIAIRAMDVDLWLWTRGGQPRYKARRRHRTRCTFY